MSLDTARRLSQHLALLHPTHAAVGLHIRLTHVPFGLPAEEFFGRSIPFRLPGGTAVLVLDGAAEIFPLALRVVCGRFRPFFRLYELPRLRAEAGPDAVRDMHESDRIPFPGRPRAARRGVRVVLGRAVPSASLETGHNPGSCRPDRWLDIQTTDRPSDALLQIVLQTRFA